MYLLAMNFGVNNVAIQLTAILTSQPVVAVVAGIVSLHRSPSSNKGSYLPDPPKEPSKYAYEMLALLYTCPSGSSCLESRWSFNYTKTLTPLCTIPRQLMSLSKVSTKVYMYAILSRCYTFHAVLCDVAIVAYARIVNCQGQGVFADFLCGC